MSTYLKGYDVLPKKGGVMSYMKYLREDQWERIKGILPGKDRDVGVTAHDNRCFEEGADMGGTRR